MTARELIAILGTRPDAEVWFRNVNYGGDFEPFEGHYLEYAVDTGHWLLDAPYQADLED